MTTFSTYLDALTSHAGTDRRARKHWLLTKAAQHTFLLLSDLVVLSVSMLVATYARVLLPFDGGEESAHVMATTAPLVAAGWLAMIYAFGGYQLRHQRAGATEYKRVVMASFTMAGLVGIGSYLLKAEFPRGLYVLLFTVGTAGLVLTRFTRRKVMATVHRQGVLLTPIIVAGESGHVDAIAKVLRRETWLGYRVVGAVTRDRVDHTTAGLPVLGSVADTVEVIEEHDIATVIFAEGSFASPADFRRMAWELEEKAVHMIVVPALTDVSAQRLDVRPVAGLPLVDVDRPQAIEAARWIKRLFDVVGSALLLLLASPVMGLVALAIKLEDRGPVMFRQTRVGRKGQVFECLKFRSMSVDAEARLAALMAKNEGAGPLFKMTNDPRITRVGRFIRRFSLDELPQLWNALRGDMSLVGPRPALPTEVAQYDSDTRRRLDVRPGLTGLWQVSGRSNLSWDDTVRLDLYYVDNWSMVQDLMILAKTAKAVVGSAGAY
ncbi:MAG: sugar transferase [Actinobacteria bacterium]|nr:sugar transferase [Actinomycetota bacterium]